MRTKEEIEADIAQVTEHGTQSQVDMEWLAWFRTVCRDIPPADLVQITQARSEGRVVVLPCKVGKQYIFFGKITVVQTPTGISRTYIKGDLSLKI